MEGRFWQNGKPEERAIENAKVGGTMKLSVLSDWRRRGGGTSEKQLAGRGQAGTQQITGAKWVARPRGLAVGGRSQSENRARMKGGDTQQLHVCLFCHLRLGEGPEAWEGTKEWRMGRGIGSLGRNEGARAWETAQRPVPIDATQGKWGPTDNKCVACLALVQPSSCRSR